MSAITQLVTDVRYANAVVRRQRCVNVYAYPSGARVTQARRRKGTLETKWLSDGKWHETEGCYVQ
jgi:hypothetical protein